MDVALDPVDKPFSCVPLITHSQSLSAPYHTVLVHVRCSVGPLLEAVFSTSSLNTIININT